MAWRELPANARDVWCFDTRIEPESCSPPSTAAHRLASVADPASSLPVAYAIPPDKPSRFEMSLGRQSVELPQEVSWGFEQEGDAEGSVTTGEEPRLTPLVVAHDVFSTSSTADRPWMHQTRPLSIRRPVERPPWAAERLRDEPAARPTAFQP